jgi:predicted short-subunit dehydrogenase-like oxidoreductase (DUF2520 family)
VVIGAGRLGASLGLALRDRGALLLAFSAATPEGRARAQGWLGGKASATLIEVVAADPDFYLLTVPDHSLAEVAAALGRLLAEAGDEVAGTAHSARRSPVVAHTSGATSVTILDDCRLAGAATLVFHPLQTFSDPSTGRARFAGAAVALTPADPRPDSPAAEFGFALARSLGARPFLLADDKRTLYHAAASVACNYLVTLEHHARRLFVASGLPEQDAASLFLPLVQTTLDNVARQGAVRALTGPLSRGDVATIEAHLGALRECAPDLLPLYRTLGLATLEILRTRAEVAPATIDELAKLLTQPLQPADPGA